MKKIISKSGLMIFLWFCSTLLIAKELDSIVAVVNEDIITKYELQKEFDTIIADLKKRNPDEPLPPANYISRQVLDKLILDRIQLDLAEREGIHRDPTILNQAVKKIAEQNGMSLGRFILKLEEQKLSFEQFKDKLQEQILLQRLQQRHVDSQIMVSEQDIDNYLFNQKKQLNTGKEYNTSIILISIPEGSTPEAIQKLKQKADGVAKKIASGKDFSSMAMMYSDAGNALEGGSLGWRKEVELPSIIADIPITLAQSEVSEVIRTPVGFVLVKLNEIKDKSQHEVEEMHARHILISTNPNRSAAQARLQLEQLRDRITQGESFATLAKAHSDDPVSASNGGDLGWFKHNTMVEEFEQTVSKMKPGEMSQIVESSFGFHLIELLDVRVRDDSREFVRQQARNELYDKKVSEKKLFWLRQLRSEAHVEIRMKEQ